MSAETIGSRIKALRKKAGLSQRALGEKLGDDGKKGVLKQQIYNYEAGKNSPPVKRLKKMSKIFKVSLEKLING